jgi:4-amino-4-deoxychorismate lyase
VNHIDGQEVGMPAIQKQLTAELSELLAGIQ